MKLTRTFENVKMAARNMNRTPTPVVTNQVAVLSNLAPPILFVRRCFFAACVLIAVAFAGPSFCAETGDAISFNRQIQPILSGYCFHCHGPDSGTRKPKKHPLRLDGPQYAFELRDDGQPVILKGHPEASVILKRLKSTDEDEVMPPPAEGKKVKPAEIALIEKWIAQGAKYEAHWSYIPPVKSVPPDRSGIGRKNPIDVFVAAKLKENGLEPNPEEQKARFFRRASFDLTGLPPSEKELHAFLKDKSPRAYENAVNRMLASDASAEHFARLWLDAVRYADTQGIHHDHSRSLWPYRDWVMAAYKSNMPFDEFTIEQLAGDLLPGAGLDQKIASGYNRLLPTTGEGGAIAEEYQAIYARDRVDTTTAVWLGLTAGCATCHDHKFDPITTKDFYSLTAFFRNNSIRVLDDGSNANTPPLVFVPAREDRPRWSELEKVIAVKTAEIDRRKETAKPEFEQWLAAASTHPLPEPSSANLTLRMPLNFAWPGTTEQHPGPFGPALGLSESTLTTADRPAFARHGHASYGAFIYIEEKPTGAVFSRMDKAHGDRGWDLFLTGGKPTVHIIDQYPDAALKITAKQVLRPGRWHHVMAVFDGAIKGAEALNLYVDGRKAEVDVNNDNLGTNITAAAPFRIGARSDEKGPSDKIKNGKVFIQEMRFYARAMTSAEVARLAATGAVRDFYSKSAKQRTSSMTNALAELYLDGFDAAGQKLRGNLAILQAEEKRLRQRGGTTLVMEDNKETEPVAYILTRGNYAAKAAKVTAATPESLPPMTAGSPRNRLGLARWIVARNNPLTARVTVNRLWSQLFGLGLVETTEDFGVMGARPSNQELLDWLAVDFMESGWDFRRLVRIMMMSATYRQSAAITPVKLEKDPFNKLLSRGPHYRLDAEEIRDQALAASGLLVRKIGGPPVRPYQPEGVWETVAMTVSNTRIYRQDKGEGLYRRSLYTFWKRIAPPPSMEILNAPSREVFCTRRDRTDTPLQAFVTMNDPQFVEAARQLAAQALASSRKFDARLDLITDSLLARRLTGPERMVARRMQERALTVFAKDTSSARALLGVGDSKSSGNFRPADLAAWTMVASQIMNLDESLTK